MVEIPELRLPPEQKIFQEFTLTKLNPEIELDAVLGHCADITTLEAYNPVDMSHDKMTDEKLLWWLKGDENHRVRFLKVDPESFYTHVDQELFEKAIETARGEKNLELVQAYETMRDEGCVGWVYLYNDENSHKPGDRWRTNQIRQKLGLEPDMPVWEVNTGFMPGTKDVPAQFAVASTLQEFTQDLQGKAVGVYFADAVDMKHAYNDAHPRSPREMIADIAASAKKVAKAALNYQDARIFGDLGFGFIDRMRYLPGVGWKDFIYATILTPAA